MPHVLYIGSQLFVAREFVICRLSFSSVGPTNMTCGRGASKTIKSIVSFLGGIIFTLVVLAVVGYFAVKGGMVPTNADSKPAALESWVANTALEAALKRDTEGLRNPIQPSDENLISGVHLYAANCAICHGASDAEPSNPAQGFYIEGPQLAKDGVEDERRSGR
jgi:hypothetical protein